VQDLARAERGAGRDGPGSKTGAGHERRRNVTEGFATRWTLLGRSKIGTQPVAPVLAQWINALHRGARHEGHNALPPAASQLTSRDEPPGWPKEFAGGQSELQRLLRRSNMVSMKKGHKI
jgi:hypothetical protein